MAKADTTLSHLGSRWLGISRLAWILMAALTILLTVLGLSKSFSEVIPACTPVGSACAPWTVSLEDLALGEQNGMSVRFLVTVYYSASLIPKLAFAFVGFLIFWRKAHDWVAQLLAMMLVLFVLEGVENLGALQPVVDVLYAFASVIFGILPFIFPNGRFVPRWMAWFAVPLTAMITLLPLTPRFGFPIKEDVYAALILFPNLVWFLFACVAVVYRYRFVSSATERQQTKWVLAGLLGSVSLFIPFTIIAVYYPPSSPSLARLYFMFLVFLPFYVLSYMFIPGGIAFAILRYRLWDIDLIIRRTLQYALLTGTLALIYFGGVVIMQGLLESATGQANSPLVTVLSTLMIAALFNPVRNRIQVFIDRRFYRGKYDAEATLARFASASRNKVDLGDISSELLDVVNETMQPVRASLWLGSGKRMK